MTGGGEFQRAFNARYSRQTDGVVGEADSTRSRWPRFLMKRLHSLLGPNGGRCKDSRPRPTRIGFRLTAPGQMNLGNAAIGKFEQDAVLIMAPGESNNG